MISGVSELAGIDDAMGAAAGLTGAGAITISGGTVALTMGAGSTSCIVSAIASFSCPVLNVRSTKGLKIVQNTQLCIRNNHVAFRFWAESDRQVCPPKWHFHQSGYIKAADAGGPPFTRPRLSLYHCLLYTAPSVVFLR